MPFIRSPIERHALTNAHKSRDFISSRDTQNSDISPRFDKKNGDLTYLHTHCKLQTT